MPILGSKLQILPLKKSLLNIQAIVLAAGLSRRMGTDNKLLLPFQQHTIIAEVLHQLNQTDVNGITLVLGHQSEAVKNAVAGVEVSLVINPDFEKGQSSSIQAGVKALPENADGFLICLGDMPALTAGHYQNLITNFRMQLSQNSKVILRPFRQSQPGHPVCFAVRYGADILAAEEADGCRQVIQQHPENLIKWHTEEAAYFLDVDTREAYEELGR